MLTPNNLTCEYFANPIGLDVRQPRLSWQASAATSPTGTFECSNRLINQLQHNIVWGQKGNFGCANRLPAT